MPEIRQIRVGGVTYDVVASEDEVAASRAQRYAEQAESSAISAKDARLTTGAYVNSARNYALAASDSADRAEAIVGGQFLSYGQNQRLSDTQKEQARVNIGKATNYVLGDKKTVIKLSNYSTNPLQGFRVEIVPRQLGSGTPTPANIRPIKGWDNVKLNHTTKNLFTIPDEVFEDRGLFSAGSTSLFGTGSAFASNAGSSNYIPLPYPITSQCTLSATVSCINGTTTTSGLSMGFIYYPGTAGASVTWSTTDLSVRRKVTSASGSVVIGIYFRGGSNPTQLRWSVSKIQLELGTTNTDYEEITSELIGNLSTPVYMGNANTHTQQLTVTHDVLVITGEENWQINTNYENTVLLSLSALPVAYTNVETNLCDRLEWSETIVGDSIFTIGNNLNIKDSTIARDVATFKSYAQAQYANGTPITFVLRRPTTYSYTLPDIPVSKFTNYSYVWSNVSDTSNSDSIQLLYMKSGVLTEEYDLYLDTKIPNVVTGLTSNRNLLDNPWFTVNQRGFTSVSYTSATTPAYCVDRWLFGGVGSLTYNSDKSITVNITSGNYGGLTQRFDPMYKGLNVTVSIMLTNGTVVSTNGQIPSASGLNRYYIALNGSTWEVLLRSDGSTWWIELRCNVSGATATIRAVKLELGSYSTLANDVPPDYAQELAKCQYYFVRMRWQALTPVCLALASTATNLNGLIVTPVAMREVSSYGIAYSGSLTTPAGNTATPTSVSVSYANQMWVQFSVSGVTSGQMYQLHTGNAAKYIDISADL